jgi:N-acetylglutamate synthase-like GNAT family acetyltransferase
MVFKQPNKEEFEQIKHLVEELWLDNENMQPEQFGILSDNGKVIAFGRLREYADTTELCSIGVVKEFQHRKFGTEIVNYLLHQAKRDVYVVTVVPDFFTKLSFKPVEKPPTPIQWKLQRCNTEFYVGTPYFAMKWEKKQN